MGSTRLPGKVLELVDGKNPSLLYTINQLKESKYLKKIIVATTTNPEDNVIFDFCQKIDILMKYYGNKGIILIIVITNS